MHESKFGTLESDNVPTGGSFLTSYEISDVICGDNMKPNFLLGCFN